MTIEFAGVFNQQSIPPGVTEYTLWGSSTEGTVDDYDTTPVVLGTKFRTSTNGQVIGARWQRYSGSLGATQFALWQGTSNLSGTQTVSSQTTSGWQRQNFSSPISISSGTLYVIAVLYDGTSFNMTRYYATGGYFNSARTVGPITAVATSESANGLYAYQSTMVQPTNTWQGGCYFVDVVFAA